MKYVLEATVPDTAYWSLLADIDSAETEIARLTENEQYCWKQVEEHTARVNVLDAVCSYAATLDQQHGTETIDEIASILHTSSSAVTRYSDTAERNGRALLTYQQRLAEYRERFSIYPADYEGTKTISKDTLKEQLSHVHGIRDGSIGLIEHDGSIYARWVFNNIYAKVSHNEYSWIVSDKPIELAISDLEVRVDLKEKTFKLASLDGDKLQDTGFAFTGVSKPHPHIMSDNGLCLGDYAGPFAEAVHNLDMETAATLLRLAVESIQHDDAAGSYWIFGIRISDDANKRVGRSDLSTSTKPDYLLQGDEIVVPDPNRRGWFMVVKEQSEDYSLAA